jgi:hypothetical protein
MDRLQVLTTLWTKSLSYISTLFCLTSSEMVPLWLYTVQVIQLIRQITQVGYGVTPLVFWLL